MFGFHTVNVGRALKEMGPGRHFTSGKGAGGGGDVSQDWRGRWKEGSLMMPPKDVCVLILGT
jgi:hypothetical protein